MRLPDPDQGLSPDEARQGETYVLSDFGTPGKSTSYEPLQAHEGKVMENPEVKHIPSGFAFAGWRRGAMVAAMSSSAAFVLNLAVTIWVGVELYKSASTAHNQILVFYRGDCHDVERTNTWVHLAINAVSAVLLSASNYCMQCLSAPTRKQVDKAHAEGKWLDVGVPSIRNLGAISPGKLLVWWILGFSSVPLHLL